VDDPVSANIATVRRFFELLNARDLDELAAITPDDFVFDRSRSRSFDNEVYRGGAGLQRLLEQAADAWDSFEFFEVEMIDAGDTVVRVGGTRGRGRGSGIEVEARGAMVWRFHEGAPVSASLFQSKEEALAEAGLDG
jgi:ketosteroid isomerase-like protein